MCLTPCPFFWTLSFLLWICDTTLSWVSSYFSFFLKIIYLFLFLAALGLNCCASFSLVAVSGGYSPVVVPGFSLQWLLLLRSTSSRAQFSSCGTQAWLLHSMWNLPRPGTEPMSPAKAGRFLTTGPPGKSSFKKFSRGFPGGPVVKTPRLHGRVQSLVGELRSHRPGDAAKRKTFLRGNRRPQLHT